MNRFFVRRPRTTRVRIDNHAEENVGPRLGGGGGKAAKREPLVDFIHGSVTISAEKSRTTKKKNLGVLIERSMVFTPATSFPFGKAAKLIGVQMYTGEDNETWRGKGGKQSNRVATDAKLNEAGTLTATLKTYHCARCGKNVYPESNKSGDKHGMWDDVMYLPCRIRREGGDVVITCASKLEGDVKLMVGSKSHTASIAQSTRRAGDDGEWESRAASATIPAPVTARVRAHSAHVCGAEKHWPTEDVSVSAKAHCATQNYDDAVFVYPNLVRWETPAGDYLKNRPKYFAFEAVERSVALKDVGYNDVNFRRVDSIDTPDLSDIKLESLARVRISQAFWETFPPGTPETYTASAVSGGPPRRGVKDLNTKALMDKFCAWYSKNGGGVAGLPDVVWVGEGTGTHPVQAMYSSNDDAGALIQRARTMSNATREERKQEKNTARNAEANTVAAEIRNRLATENWDASATEDIQILLHNLDDPVKRTPLLRQTAGVYGYRTSMGRIREKMEKREQRALDIAQAQKEKEERQAEREAQREAKAEQARLDMEARKAQREDELRRRRELRATEDAHAKATREKEKLMARHKKTDAAVLGLQKALEEHRGDSIVEEGIAHMLHCLSVTVVAEESDDDESDDDSAAGTGYRCKVSTLIGEGANNWAGRVAMLVNKSARKAARSEEKAVREKELLGQKKEAFLKKLSKEWKKFAFYDRAVRVDTLADLQRWEQDLKLLSKLKHTEFAKEYTGEDSTALAQRYGEWLAAQKKAKRDKHVDANLRRVLRIVPHVDDSANLLKALDDVLKSDSRAKYQSDLVALLEKELAKPGNASSIDAFAATHHTRLVELFHENSVLNDLKEWCKRIDYVPQKDSVWGRRKPGDNGFNAFAHAKLVKKFEDDAEDKHAWFRCFAKRSLGAKTRPFRDENELLNYFRRGGVKNTFRGPKGYLGWYMKDGQVTHMSFDDWTHRVNENYYADRREKERQKEDAKAAREAEWARKKKEKEDAKAARKAERARKKKAKTYAPTREEALQRYREKKVKKNARWDAALAAKSRYEAASRSAHPDWRHGQVRKEVQKQLKKEHKWFVAGGGEQKDEIKPRQPFPYQSALSFFINPSTPMDRMLVAWRTGSGKTDGMIKVLEAYRYDARPKILVFPKQSVVDNFFRDLLGFDNFYRTHILKVLEFELKMETPDGKKTCCNRETNHARKRIILNNMLGNKIGDDEINEARDILEMEQNSFRHAINGKHADPDRKPPPKTVLKALRELATKIIQAKNDEAKEKLIDKALRQANMQKYAFYLRQQMWPDILMLRAPLTVFTYSQAGGAMAVKKDAQCFKLRVQKDGNNPFADASRSENPYSHCITIMDEFHNISERYSAPHLRENLANLKKWLTEAKNAIVVGLTATPIISRADDAEELLNVIRGPGKKNRTNEGFITYFNDLHASLYPTVSDMEGNPSPDTYGRRIEVDMRSEYAANVSADSGEPPAYTTTALETYKSRAARLFGDLDVYRSIMESSDAKMLVPFGTSDEERDDFFQHSRVMGATLVTYDSRRRRSGEYKISKRQNEIVVRKKGGSGGGDEELELDAKDTLEINGTKTPRFGNTFRSKTAFLQSTFRKGAKLSGTPARIVVPSLLAVQRYTYTYTDNNDRDGQRKRVVKSEFKNVRIAPGTGIEIPTKNLQRRMCQYCNISKTNYTNTEKFYPEHWALMYPKLAAVVKYILTQTHRILVLVHPNCGFKAIRETMNQLVRPNSGVAFAGEETLNPRCPDPFRLELDSAQVPYGYDVVEDPPICFGKTRLSVKDLLIHLRDSGARTEKLVDEDSMRTSGERKSRRSGRVNYAESSGDEDESSDDDGEAWTSDEEEEEDEDGKIEALDDEDKALARDGEGNIVTGPRDRSNKRVAKTPVERNITFVGTMHRPEFEMIRTKRFPPVIMDRRAVRTMAEDAIEQATTAREKAKDRRSTRLRKKDKKDYSESSASKVQYNVYLRDGGKKIVFEMKDASKTTTFKITYNIVVNHAPEEKSCFSTLFEKTCSGQRLAFNEQEIRTLVVNAHEFGEGVSFFKAREIICVNPALRYAEHKQWIGRVLRSCDQPGKPLTITTFVAKGTSDFKTADEYAWEKLQRDGKTLDAAMREIKTQSIEYDGSTLLYNNLPTPKRHKRSRSSSPVGSPIGSPTGSPRAASEDNRCAHCAKYPAGYSSACLHDCMGKGL